MKLKQPSSCNAHYNHISTIPYTSFKIVVPSWVTKMDDTSLEIERQCQLSLGLMVEKTDMVFHLYHTFEHEWNLKLVCSNLQEAKEEAEERITYS